MSMSPEDIQQLLAQIARIKAGGMGPNMPPPQIQQNEAIIPEQAPASAAPLPPPVDPGPMPQRAGPPPMMQPQAPQAATPDDVRMNQLTAILDARNNPGPAAQPHGFGQKLLQNWLQPIGQGFAYGKDAPEMMARQRQQDLQNRQTDTQNLMAQIQQIQQRQQQQAELQRQHGADARAQNEDYRQRDAADREAAMAPYSIQHAKDIQAEDAYKLAHQNDPVPFSAGPDTTFGTRDRATGAVNIQGQSPKTVVPKTETEFEQKIAAFNADPKLVAKYGQGPNGYDKYQQDMRVEQAKASRAPVVDPTSVVMGNDPDHPGGQIPIVVDKASGTGKRVTLDGQTVSKDTTEQKKARAAYDESAKSFRAMQDLAKQATYISDHAMADQFFNIIKPGTGARMNNDQINRFVQPGPLRDKMLVWAQKLDQGQPLDPASRQAMLDAAEAVMHSKQPNDDAAPTAAKEQFSPSTRKYRYTTDGGKTWIDGRAPKP